MPGYFMGMVHGVNDPEAFEGYQGVSDPTVEQYSEKIVFLANRLKPAMAIGHHWALFCLSSKAPQKPASGTTPPSTNR
jgi:hypothetical protein|tara:strand:- start:159 stop:392 length:234 start_codon:yes stop_codon:yes gene_type:complete